VYAGDRQRVVIDVEARGFSHGVENANDGLRRDVVVARETAAVAHDCLEWNRHAPRRDLPFYDGASAVWPSRAGLLQGERAKQHLGDLVLRRLHERFENLAQRW